jgi:hypothetical protein
MNDKAQGKRVARLARKEFLRAANNGPAGDEEFFFAVVEVVDEGGAVVDRETVSVSLDKFPDLTTAQLQDVVDRRKAEILNRSGNRRRIALEDIQ